MNHPNADTGEVYAPNHVFSFTPAHIARFHAKYTANSNANRVILPMNVSRQTDSYLNTYSKIKLPPRNSRLQWKNRLAKARANIMTMEQLQFEMDHTFIHDSTNVSATTQPTKNQTHVKIA